MGAQCEVIKCPLEICSKPVLRKQRNYNAVKMEINAIKQSVLAGND